MLSQYVRSKTHTLGRLAGAISSGFIRGIAAILLIGCALPARAQFPSTTYPVPAMANSPQGGNGSPSNDNLVQRRRYFGNAAPRFHNYNFEYVFPQAAQPDSYMFYRRAPYYSNFPPPYTYPYTLPSYGPGVTPSVAPDIYPRYPKLWH